MNEKAVLKKISKFITEEYNQIAQKGNLVVKPVKNNIMVNNILIKNLQNGYEIINDKTKQATLKHKRIAILYASMIIKKKYNILTQLLGLDQQLDIYLQDKNIYKIRNKQNPNNPIYADRLIKAESELNFIEAQLNELEKSVSLQ